jgi:hypothetical protein
MSDFELIDAVARKTGEDSHEIQRRGFSLTGPEDSGSDLDPECMFDLIDLPETGTVDWDEVLSGHSFREPFYTSTLKARRKSRSKSTAEDGSKTSVKKQMARAA